MGGVKPTKRAQGLVVTDLMGETLVYDLERHRAHCLNPAAAVVFRHCDGSRSVDELAGILERELGVPADLDGIWLALEQLGRAGLLRQRLSRPPGTDRLSRRQLARRLGIAVLLPAVTSILVPTPAEAAASCVTSCGPPNKPFGTPCSSTAPLNCLCTCDGAGTCVGGC